MTRLADFGVRFSRPGRSIVPAMVAVLLAGCHPDPQASLDVRAAPEAASAIAAKERVVATEYMVVAANPLAAAAGLSILEKGGSAIDAAIAVQMVLGLVEPQSSGIGGGGFLLHWSQATRQLETWDGRETAPQAAGAGYFLKPDGEPMGFFEAVVGGKAVGVPGLVAMLEDAHGNHGKLAWERLFEPAIQLARDGFLVSPRLHTLLSRDRFLPTQSTAARYFYRANGTPHPVGTRLTNAPYAATLEAIAQRGASTFYRGDIAEALVAAVTTHNTNPGVLTLADLAAYRPVRRDALCAPFMAWSVCGMPPPSSGGTTVLQMLGLLDHAPTLYRDADTLARTHLMAEAGRLAFADRNAYVADPDHVDVPTTGLVDPDYLRQRARLINLQEFGGKAGPGNPPGHQTSNNAPDRRTKDTSTTHMSIVDRNGNIVSMTTSIENAFGSRLMVRGFLLNNQLTDFSFRPTGANGKPVANAVAPGKRPRSSMAPTIVFDTAGHPVLVTGSPGGSRIIGYVANNIVATLAEGLPVHEAVTRPHINNRNGRTDLEQGSPLENLVPALEQKGHTVRVTPMTSGIHAIRIYPDRLEGGADPRREGMALGR